MTTLSDFLSIFSLHKIEKELLKLLQVNDKTVAELNQYADLILNSDTNIEFNNSSLNGKQVLEILTGDEKVRKKFLQHMDTHHNSLALYDDILELDYLQTKHNAINDRCQALNMARSYKKEMKFLKETLKQAQKSKAFNNKVVIDTIAKHYLDIEIYVKKCIEYQKSMKKNILSYRFGHGRETLQKEMKKHLHDTVGCSKKIRNNVRKIINSYKVNLSKLKTQINCLRTYNLRYIESQSQTNRLIEKNLYDRPPKKQVKIPKGDSKPLMGNFDQYAEQYIKETNKQRQDFANILGQTIEKKEQARIQEIKNWANNTKKEFLQSIAAAEDSFQQFANNCNKSTTPIDVSRTQAVTATITTEFEKFQSLADDFHKYLDDIRANNPEKFGYLWQELTKDPKIRKQIWFNSYQGLNNLDAKGMPRKASTPAVDYKKQTLPRPQNNRKSNFTTPSGAPKNKSKFLNDAKKLQEIHIQKNIAHWETMTQNDYTNHFSNQQNIAQTDVKPSKTNDKVVSVASSTNPSKKVRISIPGINKVQSFYRGVANNIKFQYQYGWTNKYRYLPMDVRLQHLRIRAEAVQNKWIGKYQYMSNSQKLTALRNTGKHSRFVNQHVKPNMKVVPNPYARAGMSVMVFFLYAAPLYAADIGIDATIDSVAPKTSGDTRRRIKAGASLPIIAALDYTFFQTAHYYMPTLAEKSFMKIMLAKMVGEAKLGAFIKRGQLHALAFIIGYEIGSIINNNIQYYANEGSRTCQNIRNTFQAIWLPFIDPGEGRSWEINDRNEWEAVDQRVFMDDISKKLLTKQEAIFLHYWSKPEYRKKYMQYRLVLDGILAHGLDYLKSYYFLSHYRDKLGLEKHGITNLFPHLYSNKNNFIFRDDHKLLELNWSELLKRGKQKNKKSANDSALHIVLNDFTKDYFKINPHYTFTLEEIKDIAAFITHASIDSKIASRHLELSSLSKKKLPINSSNSKYKLHRDIAQNIDQLKLALDTVPKGLAYYRTKMAYHLCMFTTMTYYIYTGSTRVKKSKSARFNYLLKWTKGDAVNIWNNRKKDNVLPDLKSIENIVRGFFKSAQSKKRHTGKLSEKYKDQYIQYRRYRKLYINYMEKSLNVLNIDLPTIEKFTKEYTDTVTFGIEDFKNKACRNRIQDKINKIGEKKMNKSGAKKDFMSEIKTQAPSSVNLKSILKRIDIESKAIQPRVSQNFNKLPMHIQALLEHSNLNQHIKPTNESFMANQALLEHSNLKEFTKPSYNTYNNHFMNLFWLYNPALYLFKR